MACARCGSDCDTARCFCGRHARLVALTADDHPQRDHWRAVARASCGQEHLVVPPELQRPAAPPPPAAGPAPMPAHAVWVVATADPPDAELQQRARLALACPHRRPVSCCTVRCERDAQERPFAHCLECVAQSQ